MFDCRSLLRPIATRTLAKEGLSAVWAAAANQARSEMQQNEKISEKKSDNAAKQSEKAREKQAMRVFDSRVGD